MTAPEKKLEIVFLGFTPTLGDFQFALLGTSGASKRGFHPGGKRGWTMAFVFCLGLLEGLGCPRRYPSRE